MASVKVKFRPSTIEGKEGTVYYQIIQNRVIRQLKTDYRIFTNECLTELGLDGESISEKYLFTSNLKELSGAILHKTVFAFRLACLLEVEKHLNIKMPIILDSPSGKEIDHQNIEAMIKILKRDFSENQIIIASIYEYDLININKINIVNRLIE